MFTVGRRNLRSGDCLFGIRKNRNLGFLVSWEEEVGSLGSVEELEEEEAVEMVVKNGGLVRSGN
ncbi:hypothetical protein M6B38_102640 [Iris pallida]|uniref:Uncharacterized protein n=1 Tax=Iris pallida TaxID=29817 RepID=A0AAX6G6M6_IRIPA|nr:hypothetical protein M6B38_102635 [Iris pallida]KAJ6824310.1 hypothetical protein M6B38_102640 [Iris pallida]